MALTALEPTLIGASFGRSDTVVGRFYAKHDIVPRSVFLTLFLVIVIAILTTLASAGLLAGSGGTITLVGVINDRPGNVAAVQLPFVQDPVGLIVVLVGLLTPVFCARQVEAITDFVPTNSANIGPIRTASLQEVRINELADRANRLFQVIGSRWSALGFVLLAAGSSAALYASAAALGLFRSWNFSTDSSAQWSAHVYAGWWANFHFHAGSAYLLCFVAGYMFFFLIKQLLMGVVFAWYSGRALRYGFGVSPHLGSNTDGYWGLRSLRKFMQWTYASTIAHFIMTITFFAVWLPVNETTILMTLFVALINSVVVLYPTAIAIGGSLREKTTYVKQLRGSGLDHDEMTKRIDAVWSTPNLPFRVRSALTAASIYLLIPVILALVSAALGR